ncbi:MAG TPA: hypothetical protein VF212_02920 [Longimicrobiales bacterium]
MFNPFTTAAFVAAVGLMAVQLLVGRLHLVEALPRRVWVSFAAGVSIAYIFVDLLPELFAKAGRRDTVELVSLVALLGLTVAYALERLALHGRRPHAGDRIQAPPASIFWLHVSGFAVYNALIGIVMLHVEPPTVTTLAGFAVAMAFHMAVNDVGLREHHRDLFDRIGRPVLAAAVPAGWAIGWAAAPSRDVLLPGAFLAGGVLLNSIKGELPAEHDVWLWAFVLGEVLYGALLLAL